MLGEGGFGKVFVAWTADLESFHAAECLHSTTSPTTDWSMVLHAVSARLADSGLTFPVPC